MTDDAYLFPQYYPFHCWDNPTPENCGGSAREFLNLLNGPAHIIIRGDDSSRCRVVVTLQHGNEPSGLVALFHLLQKNVRPAVDIHCLIPSVDAAKKAPGFFYRTLPNQRDLNRCYKAPFGDDPQQRLAQGILATIIALQPEAVVDVHNTSGSGPSFGVTTFIDSRHDALVSLFTQRMIVTDLGLGALMEISEAIVPTVTIECGGAQDSESHLMAEEGLQNFFTRANVLSPPAADFALDFFYNPIRLEVTPPAVIAYNNNPVDGADITLLPTLEHYNFGFVPAGTELGFIRGSLGERLTAKNSDGEETLYDNFIVEQGRLKTARTLKLFMVTSNPEIALSDCLFYLVVADC